MRGCQYHICGRQERAAACSSGVAVKRNAALRSCQHSQPPSMATSSSPTLRSWHRLAQTASSPAPQPALLLFGTMPGHYPLHPHLLCASACIKILLSGTLMHQARCPMYACSSQLTWAVMQGGAADCQAAQRLQLTGPAPAAAAAVCGRACVRLRAASGAGGRARQPASGRAARPVAACACADAAQPALRETHAHRSGRAASFPTCHLKKENADIKTEPAPKKGCIAVSIP